MTVLQEEVKELLESFILINTLENDNFRLRLEIKDNTDSCELNLMFNDDYHLDNDRLFMSFTLSYFRDMIEIKSNKRFLLKMRRYQNKKYKYFKLGDYTYVVLKNIEEILPFIEDCMKYYEKTYYGWKWI